MMIRPQRHSCQALPLAHRFSGFQAFAGTRVLRLGVLILSLLCTAAVENQAQDVFYEDVVRGGATGGGYSPPATERGTGDISVALPQACTIKQAYLLAGRHGKVHPLEITFAGTSITLDAGNQVSTNFDTNFGKNSGVHAVDVTAFVDASRNIYTISIPEQKLTSNRYADFYLWICFERADLKKTHVEILLNTFTFSNDPLLYIFSLTPPNCFDIGLGLMCGYICNAELDGANLFIGEEFLGRIGGNDPQSGICGGPAANFSYFDGILRGLLGDSADDQMIGNDVLANLNSYLGSGDVGFSMTLNSKPDNALWAMFLNYGIPELEVVVVDGTLPLCPGEEVTLSTEGDFETFLWSTESQAKSITVDKPGFYSVIGFNSDGCSKSAEIEVRQRIINAGLRFEDDNIQIDADACDTQVEENLTVINDRAEAMTWGEAVSRNPALMAIIQQPSQGQMIAAGESVTIRVRIQTPMPGTFTGALEVSSSPCALPLEAQVTIIKEANRLAADRESIDFGTIPACVEPRPAAVTITNVSSVPLNISKVEVSPGYSVLPTAVEGSLAPGAVFNFVVQPDLGNGTVNGTLKLEYESTELECEKSLEVALTTEFVEDNIQLSSAAVTFPPTLSCAGGARAEVVFSNAGERTVSIEAMRPNPNVTVLGSLPLNVPAQGSASLELLFNPPQALQEVAALQFEVDVCRQVHQVAYSGLSEAPNLNLPREIDFGDPLLCGRNDSTISLKILPAPAYAQNFTITNVNISGPFQASISAGAVLPGGQEATLDVSFVPTAMGDFSGFIDISFDPCQQTQRIILRGRRQGNGVDFAPAELNFGTMKPEQLVELPVTLRNNSDQTRAIVKLRGVNAPFFINPSISLPIILEPGQETVILLRMRSLIKGEFSDELLVYTDDTSCGPLLRVPLRGSANARDNLLVSFPELRFSAGTTTVGLPLILRELGPVRLPAGGLNISVRLNRHIFQPSGFREIAETTIAVDGEDNVISAQYTLPRDAFVGDTLLHLDGLVMYDVDHTLAPITIESFEWTGATEFITETADGRLAVEKFCVDFGMDFGFAPRFGIVDVLPNPATDGRVAVNVRVSISEESTLAIYDNSGSRLIEQRWPAASFGSDALRRLELEHDLPNGLYHIILRAGELQEHRSLVIGP